MKLAGLKASADLTRQWLVVDLDAFFASVEELDDPSLVNTMPLCPKYLICLVCYISKPENTVLVKPHVFVLACSPFTSLSRSAGRAEDQANGRGRYRDDIYCEL